MIYNNLELPTEIANNPCAALTAKVNNESNMFTTKMVIELLNCKNQKVFTSEEGRSKEKDYKKGYQEALRSAFESVTAQNYNYTGTAESISDNNAIDATRDAVSEAAERVAKNEEIIPNTESSEVENTEEMGITEVEEEVVAIEEVVEIKKQVVEPLNVLYAQANSLGYQLVDSTPKVVYVLLNSSKKEVFLLKNKSGMVYKQNNTWFVEYYNENELVKKPLNIKF